MKRFRLADFLRGEECCHAALTVLRGPAGNRHTHDFGEVFWIESGTGRHEVNGTVQRLEPGSLVFVRRDDVHDFEADPGKELRLCNVAFPWGVARDLARRYPALGGRCWSCAGPMPEGRRLEPGERTRIAMAYRELVRARSNPLVRDAFLMQAALLADSVGGEGLDTAWPPWLRTACQGVARPEHFREGVPAFVRLAGRSHEHVARACRRLAGQSPSGLVNRARLRYAAEELVTTDRTILDLVQDCGFESPSHFHRLFKAAYGETPHRYRRRHRALL